MSIFDLSARRFGRAILLSLSVASPAYAQEAPSEPPTPKSLEVEAASGADRFGDYSDASAGALGLNLRWNGYLRFAGELVENDELAQTVGRTDGFKLANARIGLAAELGALFAYVSLEAAAGEADGINDPNQQMRVRLRDAYMRVQMSRLARITAGRFKSPYDLGNLKATVRRTFIDLPLESRGVLATQGYEQAGLSQGRQLGLMLHSEKVGLSDDGFDLGYALALTNGNTGDRLFNDSDSPAVFARLSLLWAEWVQLNFAGFLDRRTTGDLPDLFEEEAMGAEGSLVVAIESFYFEAQVLLQTTSFPTAGQPDVFAYGGHAQVSYAIGPFELGYRFSMLEPNTDDLRSDDLVMEHGASVVFRFEDLPLSLFLNGTLVEEQSGRQLSNNRLAALAQLTF